MKRILFAVLCFILLSLYAVRADVSLGPGDTYVYSFTSLADVVSVSPGLPSYDDYTFTLSLSDDLYYNPPDIIRIRLYENPADTVPVHNIFGESVPNLSVSPSAISIFQVPGTLWFDRTGRVEVEVLDGSVNVHHLFIDLGPGQASYSSYIEAVPEPGSVMTVLVGGGMLFSYRRSLRPRNRINRTYFSDNGSPMISPVVNRFPGGI